MTRADILIKLPRRQLADMVIELEHQLNNSEERSFDYAARLIRIKSTIDEIKGGQQMITPETKLTVETTESVYLPVPLLSFHNTNREVLRITQDGRMICGEGLSVDAATQEAAKLLIEAFEEQIQKMLDARVAADTIRMDWLEKESPEYSGIWSIDRATIDKAIKEGIK